VRLLRGSAAALPGCFGRSGLETAPHQLAGSKMVPSAIDTNFNRVAPELAELPAKTQLPPFGINRSAGEVLQLIAVHIFDLP